MGHEDHIVEAEILELQLKECLSSSMDLIAAGTVPALVVVMLRQ